ncbi:MAG TPA: hypothetical protein VFN97_05520 [Actinospica sp.]|nr:hypothetical protein [Actinospica sp.]
MTESGHRGPGSSRRGLLRAGAGGAAALGIAGIGYAAFRLGSGHGPVGQGTEAGGGASPGSGSPSSARAGAGGKAAAQMTTQPGFDHSSLAGPYTYQRMPGPDRTIVSTASGDQIAVLTDGARTVVLTGPTRTFSEPGTTSSTVTTSSWVRLAPRRWSAGAEDSTWFRSWFAEQIRATSPDLFGLYAEYAAGAPNRYDGSGLRYAGAARFGVLTSSGGYQNPLGNRDDRADFVDYLGTSYDFPDGVGKPNPEWYGDLDCSGLVRILYGYRMGFPMYLGDGPADGSALPRHSWSMSAHAPGVRLFGEGATAMPAGEELGLLLPGDLLFFAEGSDPSSVDHCGIYFGTDQYGRQRFISSRMGANGPTFGDAQGLSVIGGTGVYSRDFRGARRI